MRKFLKDCVALDGSFWYLFVVLMLFYGIVFPVQSLATAMLTTRFELSDGCARQSTFAHLVSNTYRSTASAYTSMISLMSMISSPILG